MATAKTVERYALLYPDGAMTVLKDGATDASSWDHGVYADFEANIPALVRVRIEIIGEVSAA